MVLKDHIHCIKGAIPDNMAASVRKWRANMTSSFGKMISATRLAKPCARVTNMMAIKALSPTISGDYVRMMAKYLLMLMILGLWSGCHLDLSASPTQGPEGQRLEVHHGKDSKGDSITYQFYLSGPDTVKHGDYHVYYESGEFRNWIQFEEDKRHGLEVSYALLRGCNTCCGQCRVIEGKDDTDFWRNGKCVGTGWRKCEGDEYDDY